MAFEAQRLGERFLIYRRRRAGHTKLAEEAKVNHITIARIERGHIPFVSVDVVVRLANVLAVSLTNSQDAAKTWESGPPRQP